MTGTHGVDMTDTDIKRIKRRVRVNIQKDNVIQLLCQRVTELEKIVERLQRAAVWRYF